jgi:hypothetical protein
MGKRKKKRKLGPRMTWSLVLGYFILGIVVAALFLSQVNSGAEPVNPDEASLYNAWGLFPLVVLLWPVFLVVLIIKAIL